MNILKLVNSLNTVPNKIYNIKQYTPLPVSLPWFLLFQVYEYIRIHVHFFRESVHNIRNEHTLFQSINSFISEKVYEYRKYKYVYFPIIELCPNLGSNQSGVQNNILISTATTTGPNSWLKIRPFVCLVMTDSRKSRDYDVTYTCYNKTTCSTK